MSILNNANAPTIHAENITATQNFTTNNYHLPAPHRDAEEELSRLLEALTKNNSRGVHRDNLAKRAVGTGIWFVDTVLEPWFVGAEEKLCVMGGPGTGKTTLLAIAVDYLEACADKTEGMSVGHFYCEHGNKTVTIADVLLVLLRQHLERDSDPEFVALVEQAWRRHMRENTTFSQSELERLLKAIVQRRPKTVYLLDALDEFPDDLQTNLVESLSSLGARLIITSRLSEELEKQLRGKTTFFKARAHDDDLNGLLNDRINRYRKLAAVIGQGNLRMEVAETIRANCNGMILHAALQKEALRGCKTIDEVHRALADFPSEINTFYLDTIKRIMAHLDPADVRLVTMGFVWLLTSLKPLTICDLQYALAFDLDASSPFDNRRIIPVETLMAMFCGLVAVDPVTQYVGLIHATACEFLADYLKSDPLFIHRHDALALACVAQLESQDFHRSNIESTDEFDRAMLDHPLLAYAYKNWHRHTHKSSQGATRERVIDFLAQCKTYPVEWGGTLDRFTGIHVAALYGYSEPIRDANRRTLSAQTAVCQLTPLMLASYGGHHEVVCAILQSSANSMGASHKGHADIVRLLLDVPGILVNHAMENGCTALIYASLNGHADIVRLLLDVPGILVNHAMEDGWTALMSASQNGHAGIVRLLLDVPGTLVNHAAKRGETALIVASQKGHANIVRLLLDAPGILVNHAAENGWTALMNASRNGHADIVRLLLDVPEILVSHAAKNGRTALLAALKNGHVDVVRLLESISLEPSPPGTHPGTRSIANCPEGTTGSIGANHSTRPLVAGSASDADEPRPRRRFFDRLKNLIRPADKKA